MTQTIIATFFLGLLAIACVAGAIALGYSDHDVPESLIAIGSGAAGALAGVLTTTRSTG